MKVYELANELDITSKQIVEFFSKKDIKKTQMSKMTEDEEAEIREIFKTIIPENAKEKEEKQVQGITKPVKIMKKFALDDLIECKCLKSNTVIGISAVTGGLYTWHGYGDIVEVYYKDLLAWKSGKRNILYEPKIMILDTDLMANWYKDFGKLYEIFEGLDDPHEFFEMNDNDFEEIFRSSSKPIQKMIASVAYGMIKETKYTASVRKLTIIDEVLDTILKEFI